jgi:AcrR family transcriptional regulator
MAKENKTRAPQQKRSIDKKGKILDAAYTLFCERGYYKTTTPEVAKRAAVSVGCLYSYFKDKNDLFTAVLDTYDSRFDEMRAQALIAFGQPNASYREALRNLLEKLIAIHRESRALNIEIGILSYSDPAVQERKEEQERKVLAAVRDALSADSSKLKVSDIDAAAVVVDALVDGIVERIAFGDSSLGDERLLEATLDALCAYLLP